MAKTIAPATNQLNTRNILNTIRNMSNSQYQSAVANLPANYQMQDVVHTGDIILNSPNLLNEFVNTLVNKIALTVVRSMSFNNKYRLLKKGYLEFGEVVEDIFVNIAKLYPFDPENAERNELKNWPNDVRSAFYAKNFSAQYRNSISFDQLKAAFLSYDGVANLMNELISSMYKAMEYDDMLLVKYLIIKKYNAGEIFQRAFDTGATIEDQVAVYRGITDLLTFPSTQYNAAGVLNTAEDIVMIRPAMYGGEIDVKVDAVAFNLGKTEFMGRVLSIDDFTTFDQSRFNEITAYSTQMEPVTAAELAAMANVKSFLFDERWFQIYDNLIRFTSKEVASGLRWNNYLTHECTVAASPFYTAIAFVDEANAAPATFDATIQLKATRDEGTVFVLTNPATGAVPSNVQYVNTDEASAKLVAVTRDGIVMIPDASTGVTLHATINGTEYVAGSELTAAIAEGDKITFTQAAVAAAMAAPKSKSKAGAVKV